MKNILTIFQKEFTGYFLSPIAYVFMILYLMVTNFIFFYLMNFFLANRAEMRNYFVLLPWIFLVFVPAISMRVWAEEKKSKTLELLLTWPLSDLEVVLGKFFASFAFLAFSILLSITVPISIMLLGNPDIGPILGGYAGALLMGAAYLSIGLWVSSLTENQIVAFILGLVIPLALFLIGFQPIIIHFWDPIVPLLNYLSLSSHFESITRGVFDSRDIIYYGSIIGFFLFLNVRSIESRKWE